MTSIVLRGEGINWTKLATTAAGQAYQLVDAGTRDSEILPSMSMYAFISK